MTLLDQDVAIVIEVILTQSALEILLELSSIVTICTILGILDPFTKRWIVAKCFLHFRHDLRFVDRKVSCISLQFLQN